MIKNIIFDFGQVLVHFEPEYMTRKYCENDNDVNLLKDVIFDRLYWDRLDDGTISDEEVITKVKERLPARLHKVCEEIYYNWYYNIPAFEGINDLIIELKEKYGMKLCLLSNISKGFAEHVKNNDYPILNYFDDLVLSAVCGYTKPSYEIFDYICTKNSLKKEETIFIDDSQKNINGAKNYGINTYLFDGDVPKLKEFLLSIIK